MRSKIALIFPDSFRAGTITETLGAEARFGNGRATKTLVSARALKGGKRTRKQFAKPPSGRGHNTSCVMWIVSNPARFNIPFTSSRVSQFCSRVGFAKLRD